MKINIWLILDGKRGHEKQIEDLAFSINKIKKSNITRIKKISFINIIKNFFKIGYDPCRTYPNPDLIIAAGHQTHLDALQKRGRYGGKIILVMKPSLPSFLFDLSIIPSHDKIFFPKNIFMIHGSINKIENQKKQNKNTALILIGGPSKNYLWSSKNVINEINNIISCNSNSKINFTVATSRRTPNSFKTELKQNQNNLKIIHHESVPSNWLDRNIGKYEYSWVTQDSISMLFELIASGSKVSCIKLESRNKKFKNLFHNLYKTNKVNFTNNVEDIVTNKQRLKPNTADICANYIYEHFLK